MDAREKLRQYLEQRREMGESELVLDTMTVDEALKIVGAKSVVSKPAAAVTESSPSSRATPPATDDWRAALRESGAAPEQPRQRVRDVSAPMETRHPDATL